MRHIISILLQNEAGALTRVAGLFSSRGYNIESLHVAPTQDHTVSRLTLVTAGSDEVIHQICNQLLKLVDVVNVVDMTQGDHIEREVMLLKARLGDTASSSFRGLLEDVGARTLDDRLDCYTVELTATGPELDEFVKAVERHGEVVAVVRSGTMAITHGPTSVEHGLSESSYFVSD